MKLVFKCLHCGAVAVTPTIFTGTKLEAIEIAYAQRDMPGALFGLRQYGPHDCDANTFAVAQLVAVIE